MLPPIIVDVDVEAFMVQSVRRKARVLTTNKLNDVELVSCSEPANFAICIRVDGSEIV